MLRKGYADRSDLEKIGSQWKKLSGLRSREDWSAAVVRAATAAELAANFAVRAEFAKAGEFHTEFVNSLLKWANGLDGKIRRLLKPMARDPNWKAELRSLYATAKKINDVRNEIVHSGHFLNEREALAAVEHARHFITRLVHHYDHSFTLSDELSRKQEEKAVKKTVGQSV